MYKIEDIAIGNHVMFKRAGIEDFNLDWTVIGFYKKMIEVKISEMGYDDQLFIDPEDVTRLLKVQDLRFSNPK